MIFIIMLKRFDRRFVPWLCYHTLEFWYYYVGAVVCLYFLHYFQSEIPRMAQELGDMVNNNGLENIEIGQFFLLAFAILVFRIHCTNGHF